MDTVGILITNIWGQSYKDFYTLGQIYKCILKHENAILTQIFFGHNIKILNPNILFFFLVSALLRDYSLC